MRVYGGISRELRKGTPDRLVQTEDVEAVAEPVLSHRILTNFHAESEGVNSREVIRRLVEMVREK